MAYFKGFYIPTLEATLNVAWETIKAKWPENSPCMELIRGPGPSGARPPGYDQQMGGEAAEMTELNNDAAAHSSYGDQKHVTMAEESFSYQRSESVLTYHFFLLFHLLVVGMEL